MVKADQDRNRPLQTKVVSLPVIMNAPVVSLELLSMQNFEETAQVFDRSRESDKIRTQNLCKVSLVNACIPSRW